MNDDDLHPYYQRKARKNAETIDWVVTHWKGVLVTLFLLGVISHAIS